MDWKRSLVCTFALTGLFASTGYSYQARSSAITDWDATCSGGSRGWWDDMCMGWRKQLGSKGWTQWWSNYENVTVPRYSDPIHRTWGYDNASNGFDAGTASLLCTHGGYNNIAWWGLMHHRDRNECGIDPDQMRMGTYSGGTTKFLHLSSCNGMRWSLVNAWFQVAKGGVHSVSGFHGIMYIGSGYVSEYSEMVNDSFSGASISESWVDNMHHDPIIGPTICPVSMTFGSNEDQALNRLFSERYNAQTADMTNSYGVLMWISQCTPEGGATLPN